MLVFTSFVFVVYQCYCFNHECPHAWASPTQPTCSAQFCCLYAHEHSHRRRVEGGVEPPELKAQKAEAALTHFRSLVTDVKLNLIPNSRPLPCSLLLVLLSNYPRQLALAAVAAVNLVDPPTLMDALVARFNDDVAVLAAQVKGLLGRPTLQCYLD